MNLAEEGVVLAHVRNYSDLAPLITGRNVASQSPEVKKLVYLYLLHHAGKQAASFLPVISGARSE